jgi:hypothetical protein
MEVRIKCYTPHKVGAQAHASNAKVIYVTGPVGSGKSRWAIEEIQKHVLTTPNALVFILREAYTDLTDSTIPDFFTLWNPYLCRYPGDIDKSYNKQEHDLQVCRGGNIKFRSADRPRKLQSIDKMSMFWIEEAPDISEDTFLFLLSRPRRKDVLLRRILTGYVPDNKNWVYHYFWERGEEEYQKFLFDKDGNRANLVDGYYEDLYRAYAHRPDWIKRYLEAEPVFIGKGDPVFTSFNRSIHVIPEVIDPMPEQIVWRGWDYGYDWSAVVFAQKNTFDQLVVLGCVIGHNTTVDELAPRAEKIGLEWFGNVNYLDFGGADGEYKHPLSRESIHEVLSLRGIKPSFKLAYPGCVEDGLNMIRRLLLLREDGKAGIIFSEPRCGVLIDGMAGGYSRDKNGDPDSTCRPYIDVVDALRYLVVNNFEPVPYTEPHELCGEKRNAFPHRNIDRVRR